MCIQTWHYVECLHVWRLSSCNERITSPSGQAHSEIFGSHPPHSVYGILREHSLISLDIQTQIGLVTWLTENLLWGHVISLVDHWSVGHQGSRIVYHFLRPRPNILLRALVALSYCGWSRLWRIMAWRSTISLYIAIMEVPSKLHIIMCSILARSIFPSHIILFAIMLLERILSSVTSRLKTISPIFSPSLSMRKYSLHYGLS